MDNLVILETLRRTRNNYLVPHLKSFQLFRDNWLLRGLIRTNDFRR